VIISGCHDATNPNGVTVTAMMAMTMMQEEEQEGDTAHALPPQGL